MAHSMINVRDFEMRATTSKQCANGATKAKLTKNETTTKFGKFARNSDERNERISLNY